MAALTAIYEVIERDAIAITWEAKIPRRKIRLDTLSPHNKALVEKLQQPGASLTLLHFPMDHGIPVVFSIMTSTVPEAPALVVAAAARLDPEQAIHKSLEELAQMWSFSQSCKSQRPKFSPGRQWENVIDPDSHAAVYFDHANVHLAEFLWDSPNEIAFEDIKGLSGRDQWQDLRCVVEQIHSVKHRVLVADITTEDVRNLDLHVFRAVIPGFIPLFMGYHLRPLGGTRLWSIPQTLGHAGIARVEDLNSAPHPFA
jgi:ribosomal protein S12 methylthiotransferase accessory factor